MTLADVTYLPAAPTEGAHRRAMRLMAEARAAADEQVAALERALSLVAMLSADVSEGGEAYPPGVRDIAKKISGDALWCAQTMDSIMNHAAGRRAAAMDATPL